MNNSSLAKSHPLAPPLAILLIGSVLMSYAGLRDLNQGWKVSLLVFLPLIICISGAIQVLMMKKKKKNGEQESREHREYWPAYTWLAWVAFAITLLPLAVVPTPQWIYFPAWFVTNSLLVAIFIEIGLPDWHLLSPFDREK